MLPIELDLTLGSPVVWLGLLRGMDSVKPLPEGSGPRVDEHGLLFRASEWTLSVALFTRPRVPSDVQFAPAPPRPGVRFAFSSGTGQLRYVTDADEESVIGRVFVLMDKAERTTMLLPAVAAEATLTYEWFTQDDVVYRILVWSAGSKE